MEFKEVFEPVLNFIRNLQKKDKEIASKQAAKDRLKLVLMQDRASVSPDFFELMKQEIIDVIKKYIEIDEESLEVQLTRGIETGLEGPALYANIPIKNVKPVAPKAEGEEEPMTEEKAEAVAEEILNQIENVGVALQSEPQRTEENNNENNVEVAPQDNMKKTKEDENENVGVALQGDPQKEDKNVEANAHIDPKETKSTTKKTTKTTNKKTTTKSTAKKTTTKK